MSNAIPVLIKVCSRCNTPRSIDLFNFSKKCLDGREGVCKDCRNAAQKITRQGRIDKISQSNREYSVRHYADMSPEQRAQKYLTDTRSRSKNRQKVNARFKAQRAVRAGKILAMPCVRCGSTNSQGHHEDYSKPFDLMWLCPLHHGERHRELKAEGLEP
jgi:hypothetical protein